MKALICLLTLTFSANLFANSVCIITEDNEFIYTQCDEDASSNNAAYTKRRNYFDDFTSLANEIKRLSEQGYKQTGQSERMNDRGSYDRTIVMIKEGE